jgi:hypothetical protein
MNVVRGTLILHTSNTFVLFLASHNGIFQGFLVVVACAFFGVLQQRQLHFVAFVNPFNEQRSIVRA